MAATSSVGVAAKIISNEHCSEVRTVLIEECVFDDTSLSVLLAADTSPLRAVTIRGNWSKNSRQVDPAVSGDILLGTYEAPNPPAFDQELVTIEGNLFDNLQRGALLVNCSTGHAFGTLAMHGNTYRNWSVASPGTYALVNNGGLGTYSQLMADGEICDGQGNGRCWGNASGFAAISVDNIFEMDVQFPLQTTQLHPSKLAILPTA